MPTFRDLLTVIELARAGHLVPQEQLTRVWDHHETTVVPAQQEHVLALLHVLSGTARASRAGWRRRSWPRPGGPKPI